MIKRILTLALALILALGVLPGVCMAGGYFRLSFSLDDTMGSYVFSYEGDDSAFTSPADVPSGAKVTVRLHPAEGCEVESAMVYETPASSTSHSKWVESTLTGSTLVFTMPLADCTVHITFKRTLSPPVITAQPENLSLKEGEPIAFAVAASGEGLHYRWTVVTGENSETFFDSAYDSPSLTYTRSCTYAEHNGLTAWCEVYNLSGGTVSDTVTVTVAKKPVLTGNPFADVKESDWFYADVLAAVSLGIVDGMSDTVFAPENYLTNAAAVKLACGIHQLYRTGSFTLTNSATGNWYDSYVTYAAENGIPLPAAADMEHIIDRRDFVRIFYYALPVGEYAVINPVTDGAIPDVPYDLTDFSRIAYTFYRSGILTGSDESGAFLPESNIRRCEVAAIISRMMDKAARKHVVLPAPDVSALGMPCIYTATGERVIFFTARDGLPAVLFGTWDYTGGREANFITRVEGHEGTLRVYYYNPPVAEPADYQDTLTRTGVIVMDVSGLDIDGIARISIDGGEVFQYKNAGATWQDGYDYVHFGT